jgi:uncharacterized cupin superfamily protein
MMEMTYVVNQSSRNERISMKKVTTDEMDHIDHPIGINTVRKPISEALGTTDFAMVYHELEPGESFSAGVHAHHDQEEVFYVIKGTATFEVERERNQIIVEAGEAIRFAPGEFQRGYNQSDARVVALIIAAPGTEHDWAETQAFVPCRTCGKRTIHSVEPLESASWKAERVHLQSTCEECETSFTTADIVGT